MFLLGVLFLSLSASGRESGFTLCRGWTASVSSVDPRTRQYVSSQYIEINSYLTHSLNALPALNICFNRKLLPLPRTRPNLTVQLLLLLAGDVSVNPGPSHNLRAATVNARSMRDKGPALADLVQGKNLDVLGITET